MTPVIQEQRGSDVGRTVVTAKVTSASDLSRLREDLIDEDAVRSEEVEVLVDTGATYLSLPRAVIARLGLSKTRERRVTTTNGEAVRNVYSSVELEVMGRAEETPVMEVPDGVPALLGDVPLEILDLVVNPKEQRLEGNPEHGGEFVLDQL
jgi:clan AA aspartic protease